jgi:predicted anti-sigma-YlaC factor YlaD
MMQCDRWQEALSAMADNEDPGVEPRLVQAHLADCPDCRSFAAAVDGSRRRGVVRPARPMPDLSRRVSKLNALADRASRWSVVRALLVIVALEVIVVSVPSLMASDAHTNAHDTRHLGAFTIAYGVALLVVAARPARARTVLPVAAVLAGALLITAVVDLARGAVPLVGEATHLPEVVSVVLIWLLAVPAPRRAGNGIGSSVRSTLTLIDAGRRDRRSG